MQTSIKSIAVIALALAWVGSAWGAEVSIAGKWKAQFDSQIGVQKYTYDFKVDGEKLTGKAIGEREMGTNDVEITDGKISGDEISFVEPLNFDGNELRIEYKGKVSGDEIKFKRNVGDVATEEFVAKRVKDEKPEAKPEGEATTNSPAKKP